MKNLLDLHTHTMFCNHAYSTLNENVERALELGLKVFGWSEHGYGMDETTSKFLFLNLKSIPEEIKGMRILKGMEANIIDFEGNIYEKEYLPVVDYVIASLHRNCIKSGSKSENTKAVIEALKNKYVNILGHLDDGYYELDYKEIVKAAKEYGVAIEVNNSSLSARNFRINSRENIMTMLEKCDKYSNNIIMNTDAHFITEVGNISEAEKIVKECKFKEELILNYNVEKLGKYLNVNL